MPASVGSSLGRSKTFHVGRERGDVRGGQEAALASDLLSVAVRSRRVRPGLPSWVHPRARRAVRTL